MAKASVLSAFATHLSTQLGTVKYCRQQPIRPNPSQSNSHSTTTRIQQESHTQGCSFLNDLDLEAAQCVVDVCLRDLFATATLHKDGSRVEHIVQKTIEMFA